MQKNFISGLLFVAAMAVLKGTCMYAQSNLADKYAWRLDSVVYTYPSYTVEDDPEEVRADHYTEYRYTDDTLEVLSVERDTWHDTTYILMPTKTLYTKADSGLYLKESLRPKRGYYETFDSLQYVEFRNPTQKELYFQNDYRNVYDEEGHLLRQIRNYDYLLFMEESFEDGSVSWYEDSRFIKQESDTVSLEKTYIYNYDADSAWVPFLNKSLYSRYTDHRLSYKETKNVYTWHANGKPATHNVAYARYNRLGVQTESATVSESWNANGDSLSFTSEVKEYKAGVEQSTTTNKRTYAYDSTGVLQKKTVQHLFWPAYNYGGGYYLTDTVFDITDTYTYDETGELTGLSRYENDYDAGYRLNYRTLYAHWENGKWVTDKDYRWSLRTKPEGGKASDLVYEHQYSATSEYHHVVERDSLYRVTLDYDTTYNTATSTGSCHRKEYRNGVLLVECNRQATPAWGGWVTTYENIRYDKYTSIININDGNIRDGARDTLRWTEHNYHNGFDKLEMCERFNRQTREWDVLWCNKMRTMFDDDGTPLSAIKYESSDGGQTWRSSEAYIFQFDTDKQCYVRTFSAYMGIHDDGTPYSWTPGYLSQEFFLKNGSSVGYLQEYYDGTTNGSYDIYEYDEQGRRVASYTYSYVDSTQTWELYSREDDLYYPEPDCCISAVSIFNKLDSAGNWYISHVFGTGTASRTFDIYDEHGAFIERHNYAWRDSALVCDTVIYYRYTYDEAGQMTDCVKYRQYNNGVKSNEPMQKYHYFYHEDGTRFPCYTWQDYKGDGLWTNKAGLTQSGLGYVRTDEQGRTTENIYFSTDSAGLVLTPKERNLFYYEGDEIDWIRKETFTWNLADNAWKEAGVTSRLPEAQGTYHFDGQGNLIDREESNGMTWHCTYGAALEDYPVLQPSTFGVQDEADLFTVLNGVQPASRILTIHHKGLSNGVFSLTNNHYMARFYYTQLQEDTDPVKTELEEEITVEPEENTATFTWPAVSGGMSYTLIIWANKERTEKVCALQLAADGTLLEIDFSRAPRRAPAACWAAPVLNTTIENLLAGTQYWYTLEAYDEVELLLETTYGTFTTAESTEGLMDVQGDDVPCTKMVRDGQIFLIREGQMYDIRGVKITD